MSRRMQLDDEECERLYQNAEMQKPKVPKFKREAYDFIFAVCCTILFAGSLWAIYELFWG